MNNQSSSANAPTLSIICPMRDEEESVQGFFDKLLPVLTSLGEEFEMVTCYDLEPGASLIQGINMECRPMAFVKTPLI